VLVALGSLFVRMMADLAVVVANHHQIRFNEENTNSQILHNEKCVS
jgi:hypothetical protein